MGSKYINGYSTPRFLIYDKINLSWIDTIDLNLCDSEGLIEDNKPIGINFDLIDYSTIPEWFGFHTYFKLSYSENSTKENSLKIKKLMNYFFSNDCIIKLIPRIDDIKRIKEIIFTGENITIGIKKGGSKARGNRLIVLNFRTKDLETKLDWTDPDERTIVTDWIVDHNI